MAKIFGQSQGVPISGQITAWEILSDSITVIATMFSSDNLSYEGDVLIIEATDANGKMYIPLYALAPARFEADGQYPNQFRWNLNFDSSLYDLTEASFAINDGQYIRVQDITDVFPVPNSVSFEERFENATYGQSMKSYKTEVSNFMILPRFLFKLKNFNKVYKNMGEYMIYVDDTRNYSYKIVTDEEAILATGTKSARNFKFKLPVR